MRRLGCSLLVIAVPISGAFAIPKSASPRPTMAMITVSPAVGCTSVLSPPFSFNTLAMAELVV